jgi:hypothetical protein
MVATRVECTARIPGQEDCTVLAEREGGKPIGYLAFSAFDKKLYVHWIEVVLRHRRKGVGLEMVKAMADSYPGYPVVWGLFTGPGEALYMKAREIHPHLGYFAWPWPFSKIFPIRLPWTGQRDFWRRWWRAQKSGHWNDPKIVGPIIRDQAVGCWFDSFYLGYMPAYMADRMLRRELLVGQGQDLKPKPGQYHRARLVLEHLRKLREKEGQKIPVQPWEQKKKPFTNLKFTSPAAKKKSDAVIARWRKKIRATKTADKYRDHFPAFAKEMGEIQLRNGLPNVVGTAACGSGDRDYMNYATINIGETPGRTNRMFKLEAQTLSEINPDDAAHFWEMYKFYRDFVHAEPWRKMLDKEHRDRWKPGGTWFEIKKRAGTSDKEFKRQEKLWKERQRTYRSAINMARNRARSNLVDQVKAGDWKRGAAKIRIEHTWTRRPWWCLFVYCSYPWDEVTMRESHWETIPDVLQLNGLGIRKENENGKTTYLIFHLLTGRKLRGGFKTEHDAKMMLVRYLLLTPRGFWLKTRDGKRMVAELKKNQAFMQAYQQAGDAPDSMINRPAIFKNVFGIPPDKWLLSTKL